MRPQVYNLMSTERSDPMPDSLQRLLHEWEVKPEPDPAFRAAVWRRITARRQRFVYRVWNRAEAIASRPIGAAAVFSVLLFAGATLGNAWQSHGARQEQVAGLRAYVLAVNPVAHAASHR